jgi:hypothetical protein
MIMVISGLRRARPPRIRRNDPARRGVQQRREDQQKAADNDPVSAGQAPSRRRGHNTISIDKRARHSVPCIRTNF